MSKYVRTIYLYVVSFITLCMIVVGIVGTVNSITSYYFPTVYYYSNYEYGTKEYNLGYNDELLSKKRSSLKEMFTFIAVAVVGAPLFAYHWKSILKEEKEEV